VPNFWRNSCNGTLSAVTHVTAAGNFVYTAYPNVDVGCSSSSPQCLKNAFSIGTYSGFRHIPALQEAFEVYGFHWGPQIHSATAPGRVERARWTTRTECISALVRQSREGSLTSAGERQAREVLDTLANVWIEIQPTGSLRATAKRALAVHSLRAADAFQLAAALQWCRGQTAGMSLVCFDDRLRTACRSSSGQLI